MDMYVTGNTIKRIREERNMTQTALAERIGVSDKAVSKWENGKGYPDITLLEPIAEALGISVMELLSGNEIVNRNRNSNIRRSKLYICPVCGNVIHALGDAVISCCGVSLIPEEAEAPDEEHMMQVGEVEDEYYVTMDHPMTKEHHISFLGAMTFDGIQFVKLYPEGSCEARFKRRGTRQIYCYCNRHGLFRTDIRKKGREK